MRKNFDEFDLQEARRIAETDTGKQIMAMLQQNRSPQLQSAMDSAKTGDFGQMQQVLASLMADPNMQALMKKLQEEQHG